MKTVNLAEAKVHLSELVAAAAAGKPVCILRRGKPMAQLVAASGVRQRIDATRLRAVTLTMPLQSEPAGEFVRHMRDDERLLMLYLDTSLLVAALTSETRTSFVQQWLEDQDPEELAVSDWVVAEFSSALSIKLRTGQIGPAHRADALAMFTTSAATASIW